MTAKAAVTELTLESTLASVETAEEVAHRVSMEAGFDEEEQHKIEMAVHESVINAVAHGNKLDTRKKVHVRFELSRDRLEIRIRDEGSGLDLSRIPDPLAVENLLRVSGRGIFLIRTFMDEMRVEHPFGTGTELIMVKRIDSKNESS